MAKKATILCLVTSPLYSEKGASLRSYGVLKDLSKSYRLIVVTYAQGRHFELPNTLVIRTPRWFRPTLRPSQVSAAKVVLDLFVAIRALGALMKYRPQVIHCEDFEAAAIGWLITAFGRLIPYSYDLHNRIVDNLRLAEAPKWVVSVAALIERRVLSAASLVLLNWAKYRAHPLLAKRPTVLRYDGIDMGVRRNGLPFSRFLIYAGNFEPYQGIDEFIDSFAELDPDIGLVLVGDMPARVERRIDRARLNTKVLPLGRQPIPDTNWLMQHALGGILPRKQDSSMKAVHYIVNELPVLALDTPSNRELVTDGGTGWLYSSDSQLHKLLTRMEREGEVMKARLTPRIREAKDQIMKTWSADHLHREMDRIISNGCESSSSNKS